jgi:hypothetical protein
MARKATAKTEGKQVSNKSSNIGRDKQTSIEVKAETKPAYRYEKIGTVAIDTGHVVIVDPCRVDEVQDRFHEPLEPTAQLGQFVVGSQTGLGDGRYPVFAEIINDEHVGERVVALHVHFDPMYCFADDPDYAKRIKDEEAQFLASMNEA